MNGGVSKSIRIPDGQRANLTHSQDITRYAFRLDKTRIPHGFQNTICITYFRRRSETSA
jgi:hypothetical protein